MLVFYPVMLVLGLGFKASFVGLGMFGLGLGRCGLSVNWLHCCPWPWTPCPWPCIMSDLGVGLLALTLLAFLTSLFVCVFGT